MNLTPQQKMTKAKAGLVLDSPFFASLLLRLQIKEDPTCQTIWIDGKTTGYNPKFIDALPLDQLKGILCHEIMHIVLNHHTRRQERDHETWNKAGDYAINSIIENAGFHLPQERLRNPNFDSKEAETIYSTIYVPKPKPEEGNQGNDGQKPGQDPGQSPQGNTPPEVPPPEAPPWNFGEVRDLQGKDNQPATPSEKAQNEEDWKIAAQQALTIGKKQGKIPGDLERLIKELLEPRIDWKEVLSRFICENSRNDYTWKQPNPRYNHQGLYLPILKNPEIGQIVVIIDTSGSIDQETLNTFAGEIQGILGQYDSKDLEILYVDSKFQGNQTLNVYDKIGLHPKGGGGTDFRPGFTWIEENQIDPACVIYLTDGECERFPDPPEYPVLWILTEKPKYQDWTPPFGETIIMKG